MSHYDPADFTTDIDNPFFTLRAGTTFVYEEPDTGTVVRTTVTDRTRVIDGVTCVVVRDREFVNGQLVEDTLDFYAQDSEGNVWYFGEETEEFEPGDPDPVSTEGSWKAGVDGADAGIIMLADPQVGDSYQQEFAPDVAEDWAQVLGLSAQVDTPYVSSLNALQTLDVNPLELDVETKFFVAGIGNVLAVGADGGREQLTEVIVTGTAGNDRLDGYVGGDHIKGRGGDDRLFGLDGNDIMTGGTGDDALRGGRGHDDLSGNAGDDILHGAGGADTFIFRNLADGTADTDTILDYRKSHVDVVDLPSGAGNIASEAMVGSDWELTLTGDGDVIRLIGAVDENGDGSIIDDLLIA
jgi:Ca2+-binding RTX toxin-like protein